MSVKLFFWNVCGLNDPDKHRPFISWLHQNKPIFGAILESHIKEPFLSPIIYNLCTAGVIPLITSLMKMGASS